MRSFRHLSPRHLNNAAFRLAQLLSGNMRIRISPFMSYFWVLISFTLLSCAQTNTVRTGSVDGMISYENQTGHHQTERQVKKEKEERFEESLIRTSIIFGPIIVILALLFALGSYSQAAH
ncbi:MAG: hypothetical protein OCC49_10510 [Fibrobacterales bacterium]